MAHSMAGWQQAQSLALRAATQWRWMEEAVTGGAFASLAAWPDAWSPLDAVASRASPADVIVGTKGDDSLAGTDAADLINGRQGADTMAGAGGHDVYVVDNLGDVVEEAAGGGIDTVLSRVSYSLAANIENLRLTGADNLQGTGNELDNFISGNQGSNQLQGAEGRDTIYGGRGNDSLDGGAGADLMVGGEGDDTFNVDDPGDVTVELQGGGNDTVYATVTWTLAPHIENLTLGYAYTQIDGYGNALDNLIAGGPTVNLIDGGAGNDTITGTNDLSPYVADTLIGGAGDDSITGGGLLGNDLVYGGTGNDTLTGSNASLYGEDGNDYLQGGQMDGHHAPGNIVSGGAGQDTLLGGGSMDGGDGDDWLESGIFVSAVGGDGNDTISGIGGGGYYDFSLDAGSGDDVIDISAFSKLTLQAGSGNDKIDCYYMRQASLDAGSGDDEVTLSGGAGEPYAVQGGSGNDTIRADGFGGSVNGGVGDDWVFAAARNGLAAEARGGQGNDTLTGGGGLATLIGGDGHDTFVLTMKEVLYEDMLAVRDFSAGTDHLEVSQASLGVGNGDLQVDGATTIDGPGGFDSSAELVIVAADIFGDLSLDAAAAAIGSANQGYAAGQTAVFVVDNGVDSWLLYFESSGSDAAVSAAELSIAARLNQSVGVQVGDVTWSA
ncbi:calcium-binding protein [Ideonella sp.]|uniref:calcium-binding protein n=1 Tax=Ideonella sp. TaxID=1929293 RepID=UPI0035ADA7E9